MTTVKATNITHIEWSGARSIDMRALLISTAARVQVAAAEKLRQAQTEIIRISATADHADETENEDHSRSTSG